MSYNNKVLISASFASGNSMVKSLAFDEDKTSYTLFDTVHGTWFKMTNHKGYFINTVHEVVGKRSDSKTVMIYNNPTNMKQILQRSIILEFLYADYIKKNNIDITRKNLGDSGIVSRWTVEKYQQIAGKDWPPYSTDHKDYSKDIMNEMCELATQEFGQWSTKTDADVIINSEEIYSGSEPIGIKKFLELVEVEFNKTIHNRLIEWQQKQTIFFNKYKPCFE